MANKIEIEFADVHSTNQVSEAVSLIMREIGGTRYVPIIIGISEARAILLEVNKVHTSRPLTHELLSNLMKRLEVNIEEVNIVHYSEGVFYAEMVMKMAGSEVFFLDARPSDAIAVAIRRKVPIYMNGDVFEANCINDKKTAEKPAEKEKPPESGDLSDDESDLSDGNIVQDEYIDRKLSEMTTAELQNLLEGAIESEDYELAGKIQAELNRRQ